MTAGTEPFYRITPTGFSSGNAGDGTDRRGSLTIQQGGISASISAPAREGDVQSTGRLQSGPAANLRLDLRLRGRRRRYGRATRSRSRKMANLGLEFEAAAREELFNGNSCPDLVD